MNKNRVEIDGEGASGRGPNASSLIPMLIASLILIVIGAACVMMFA